MAATLAASFLAPASADDTGYHPADAERGKAIAGVCLTCHGTPDMLSGAEPAFRVPLLAGQRGEAIFKALSDYRNGARRSAVMAPIVAGLSVQDMRDLAAFLSASGPYVPATVDQGSAAHEQARRDCTACHGESGMGVMAGVPVLTGQYADYLVHALDAYRDGSRDDPTMRRIAAKLTPEEISALATYFGRHEHLAVATAETSGGTQRSLAAGTEAGTSDARASATSIAMVDIPAGKFSMGTRAEDGFQNGFPPHEVTVAAFRLAATEVTFAQYDAFARATGRELPPDETWGRGDRPVIHVDWSDIHAFIDWLNADTGRRLCRRRRRRLGIHCARRPARREPFRPVRHPRQRLGIRRRLPACQLRRRAR